MYKITIRKTANKELHNLPSKIIPKITQAIFSLADQPRPQGCKKGVPQLCYNGFH